MKQWLLEMQEAEELGDADDWLTPEEQEAENIAEGADHELENYGQGLGSGFATTGKAGAVVCCGQDE
jgi:hypothetical protein